MNNFDERLVNILKKFHLIKNDFKDVDIIGIIGEIINKNIKGNFAIWGAGVHTEVLFKHFSFEFRKCMFIVDNNKKLLDTNFLGFKVISSEEIINYNIDTIFISSYGGRKDIKNQIEELLPKCKAIDFYDILEKQEGIKLDRPFYLREDTYKYLFKLKEMYMNEQNVREKQNILQKIIYSYLCIRDVYNAKNFINLYIKNNYDEKEKFINLLKELDKLLSDIKLNIMERKGNDIVLFFLDSLRSKDVYNENSPMKFLNSLLDKSKYFTNAFSPSIFTYESVPAILSGKLPFYNKLYKRKDVDQEEVPFIQEALSKAYSIKIYFPDFWNVITGDRIERGKYNAIMSKNIWNAICDLSENKNEKTIYLLYFLQETHPPHICGYHTIQPIGHSTPFTCNGTIKQSQQQFNIQYQDCLKYVDKQLEYYFNIMGDDITKIIFSDHGQIVENAMSSLEDIGTLAGWHDDRYHIPLILSGNKVKCSKCDDIFSMLNFNDLIISLIDNKEYINNEEYIEVNFSPICNDTIKQKYIKAGYDDYLYGFKVLRDDKFKLVITGKGKYKVYILPEQFEECTDKNIKNKVINYFSKVADISIPKLL
jgi:hypothetical protein